MPERLSGGISGPSIDVTEFAVNDRISFSGAEGTVIKIETDPYAMLFDFPVHVHMDTGMHLHFTSDGKFMKTQKCAVIVKIGAVEPKVKRWRYVFIDALGEPRLSSSTYTQGEAADTFQRTSEKVEFTETES